MSHKSYLPVLGALTAQSSALNAPRSVRVFGQRAARGARRGLMGLVGLFGVSALCARGCVELLPCLRQAAKSKPK